MSDGKKFDVVIMNPPYSDRSDDSICLKFSDRVLDISNINVVIQPFNIITKTSQKYKSFKEKYDKYLLDVEEVSYKYFKDTNMPNVGIYKFSYEKENDNIKIKYINGEEKTFDSLLNYTNFNNYEIDILKYLDSNENINYNKFGHGFFGENEIESIKKYVNDRFNDNKIFMLTANTGDKYITKNLGQIFKNKNELIDGLLKYHKACTIMTFNSIKAAENCKIALQNPLLKFVLNKIKEGRSITKKDYQYIPDIDWSNSKCTTDEGLLELCGCPKDKAKEYAEYCKKVIEEVDKK